jgi:cytoskeleton protein RodZ
MDRTDDVLRDIGQLLREARHGRGEDAYDIAEYLRIRPAYLFALEQGDLSIMPGRTYAMGFLRTYGDYLALDGNELVHRLRDVGAEAVAPEPELVYRTPEPENRRPTKLLVAVSLMGAVFIYGSWYLSYSGFMPILTSVAALPETVGQMAMSLMADDQPAVAANGGTLVADAGGGASAGGSGNLLDRAPKPESSLDDLRLNAPDPSSRPSPMAAAAATQPVVSDGTSALAAERLPPGARQTASNGSAGELLAALETPSAANATAAGSRTFGATEDPGRVVLVAHDSSWIQVRSTARDYIRTRTLEPGDRFVLPNRTDLSLWTGNAGGIEVTVDGRTLGILGASGDVIRQLSLTPQDLQSRRMAQR